MYSLIFYVPETDLDKVKQALFSVGAGALGNYDHYCWQIKGEGQFRPLEGADPHSGKVNEISHICEYRVEMLLQEDVKQSAINALLSSHPYEEVAYHIIPIQR
ncbi:Putative GTP cyclohydrolase 1 type 2 [Marinomonas spartinae]|uniref:Putative GTP cyclohydrolase 1 type 2 n=1 Tax=Marinomonas spartinae TaxID=1792290 RepID=A0A1A8TQD1_9GAMM|nr:NGG1p interacting factor NIF3 [Marinomonas spartinae]SBS35090.1 Putative GTP cyclohydrolase 1 type 2 [Marinomonas spartinae]SBS36539.1 Putative GTP cyclohydrolase 1 type 2 [Marinomonas spartinae]